MTEKDAALQRLYKRLYEAIDAKRIPWSAQSTRRAGYNEAIEDVLEILDTSDDETWYEEEL